MKCGQERLDRKWWVSIISRLTSVAAILPSHTLKKIMMIITSDKEVMESMCLEFIMYSKSDNQK